MDYEEIPRFKVSYNGFLSNDLCNHANGIEGGWVNELLDVAKILGIEAQVFA